MAEVYILYSAKLDRFYAGSCKVFSFRIEQHLSKQFADAFTSRADDWRLFLQIKELEYQQARSIETDIKKMNSSIYIRNLKKYPEMIIKLKQKYG